MDTNIPQEEIPGRAEALAHIRQARKKLIEMGRIKYNPLLDGCILCGDPVWQAEDGTPLSDQCQRCLDEAWP